MPVLSKTWFREDDGQDLVEYTLLIAFITMASAALLLYNTATVAKIWANADLRLRQVGGL
jgi:Flp pilus assembly pilin Flp